MMRALLPFLALVAQAQPASPKPELSRCYSIYNPVALGTEWEYRGENRSNNREGQASLTRSESRQRVVALTPDSMRLQAAGRYTTLGHESPFSTTTDYVCGDEGAVAANMSAGQRITYRGSQTPLRSEVGFKWESSTEMIDSDGTGIRSIMRHEVVGTESVTVPAGQFEALKVAWTHETVRVDPDAKRLKEFQKIDRDTQTIMKGFRWYAPHVGLVRNSFENTTVFKGKPHGHGEGVDELIAFRP